MYKTKIKKFFVELCLVDTSFGSFTEKVSLGLCGYKYTDN